MTTPSDDFDALVAASLSDVADDDRTTVERRVGSCGGTCPIDHDILLVADADGDVGYLDTARVPGEGAHLLMRTMPDGVVLDAAAVAELIAYLIERFPQ